MKKLLLIAFLGISLITLAIGCKKDSNTAETIVGKWDLEGDSLTVYNAGNIISSGPAMSKTINYIQFKADGSGNDLYTTFTYKIKGKTLTISYAPYILLSVAHGGSVANATIRALTKNKLTIFAEDIFKDGNGLKNGSDRILYLVR
jgi:hypothetical protein